RCRAIRGSASFRPCPAHARPTSTTIARPRQQSFSAPPADGGRSQSRSAPEMLAGRTLEEFGRWIHYLWSGLLVHTLPQSEFALCDSTQPQQDHYGGTAAL